MNARLDPIFLFIFLLLIQELFAPVNRAPKALLTAKNGFVEGCDASNRKI